MIRRLIFSIFRINPWNNILDLYLFKHLKNLTYKSTYWSKLFFTFVNNRFRIIETKFLVGLMQLILYFYLVYLVLLLILIYFNILVFLFVFTCIKNIKSLKWRHLYNKNFIKIVFLLKITKNIIKFIKINLCFYIFLLKKL